MKIKKIEVKNFRLLKDVKLSLERDTTLIVGRNNSGKTSLTEIFRRLIGEKPPSFSIYDFSVSSIEGFKAALLSRLRGEGDLEVRSQIPFIEIKIFIEYPTDSSDLGILGDFIIDLDIANNIAVVAVQYALKDGKLNELFHGYYEANDITLKTFVKDLKERVPQLFETRITAEDPNDPDNTAVVEHSKFRTLIGAGFINAQRGLDDVTHAEKDVLGKVLAKLFKTSKAEAAPADLKAKSEDLQVIINDIQSKVDKDFNEKLDELLPALELFGYPGLADPNLSTETTLDVSNILDSYTRIRYKQGESIFLPETYNGLGSRNLIYILFQLFEFFRQYQSRPTASCLDVIFIEEPEAHLHPQMQQIFIRKLSEIANEFSKKLNQGKPWPVQFIVTTHSTHIANEAKFEAIRYFLTSGDKQRSTTIKDLRLEFAATDIAEDKEFLHKYLTLTKCDLYFADKAILIEGAVERIMMPLLIHKSVAKEAKDSSLSSQYVTVIEVGGAYAHHFYKFLDFLELKSLIITDVDSVTKVIKDKKTQYTSCPVSKGQFTTNLGIKNWFAKDSEGHLPLESFHTKAPNEKIIKQRRIAYQIPEDGKSAIGRSFEEAFILANREIFSIQDVPESEVEQLASDIAPDNKNKTEFAMKYGLEETSWLVPKYILEGLLWLSGNEYTVAESEL